MIRRSAPERRLPIARRLDISEGQVLQLFLLIEFCCIVLASKTWMRASLSRTHKSSQWLQV